MELRLAVCAVQHRHVSWWEEIVSMDEGMRTRYVGRVHGNKAKCRLDPTLPLPQSQSRLASLSHPKSHPYLPLASLPLNLVPFLPPALTSSLTHTLIPPRPPSLTSVRPSSPRRPLCRQLTSAPHAWTRADTPGGREVRVWRGECVCVCVCERR